MAQNVTVPMFTYIGPTNQNNIGRNADLNKTVSCKHVDWKFLIRTGSLGKKFLSGQDGWFMLVNFQVKTHVNR